MGLFGNILGKGKSGGLMNVIRCDEEEYLVWKWRPAGQEVNSTSRENAIRYGSTLVVKDGELAVLYIVSQVVAQLRTSLKVLIRTPSRHRTSLYWQVS